MGVWFIIMEMEARKVSIGGPCTCLHVIMAFGWRGQRKSEIRKKKMMMVPDQTWTKCCSLNNACIYGFRAKRAKVAAVNDGLLNIPLLQNIYIYICMHVFHNENQRACSPIFLSHSDIIITSSRSWYTARFRRDQLLFFHEIDFYLVLL